MNNQTAMNPPQPAFRGFWKFITYLFFPGFVTTATALYLSFQLSQFPWDTLKPIDTETTQLSPHLYYFIPIAGFLLIPMIASFILKHSNKINSLEMHTAKERILPLIASIFGSFVVLAFFGDELKILQRHYIFQPKSAELLLFQATFLAAIVTVSLFLITLSNYLQFKISIHSSAISSATLFLWISSLQQNNALQLKSQPFPTALPIGIILTVLVYVSRRKLKAHSHKELLLGIALAATINGIFALIMQALLSR